MVVGFIVSRLSFLVIWFNIKVSINFYNFLEYNEYSVDLSIVV